MTVDTLDQVVNAVEQAVISVVGEEFVVLAQTENDCFTITVVIPKDEKDE